MSRTSAVSRSSRGFGALSLTSPWPHRVAPALQVVKIRGLTPKEDFGDLSEPPTDTTNGRSSADPNSLPPEISPASNASIFSSFTMQSDGSEAPGIVAARSALGSLTVKSFKERSVELWQYGAAAAAAASAVAASAATAASVAATDAATAAGAAASAATTSWRSEGASATDMAPASLQDDDEESSAGRLGQSGQNGSRALSELNGHATEAPPPGKARPVSDVEVELGQVNPTPKVVGGAPKSLRSSKRGPATVRSRPLDGADAAAGQAAVVPPAASADANDAGSGPLSPAAPPAPAPASVPVPASAAVPATAGATPRSLRSGRSQRSSVSSRRSVDDAESAAAEAAAAAAAAAFSAPPEPAPASILDAEGTQPAPPSLIDHNIQDPFQPAPAVPSSPPAPAPAVTVPEPVPPPAPASVPVPPPAPTPAPASPEVPVAAPMYDPTAFRAQTPARAAAETSGREAEGPPPAPPSDVSEDDAATYDPEKDDDSDDMSTGSRTRGGAGESPEDGADGEGAAKPRKWSRTPPAIAHTAGLMRLDFNTFDTRGVLAR